MFCHSLLLRNWQDVLAFLHEENVLNLIYGLYLIIIPTLASLQMLQHCIFLAMARTFSKKVNIPLLRRTISLIIVANVWLYFDVIWQLNTLHASVSLHCICPKPPKQHCLWKLCVSPWLSNSFISKASSQMFILYKINQRTKTRGYQKVEYLRHNFPLIISQKHADYENLERGS